MASAEELINDARNYAGEVLGDARIALDSAVSRINSVGYLSPNVELDPIDQQLDLPELSPVPAFSGVPFNLPKEPGEAPAYQDIGNIDTSGAPSLQASVPTVVLPSQPSPIAAFTGTLPAINTQVDFPEPPDQLVAAADHAVIGARNNQDDLRMIHTATGAAICGWAS